MDRYFVPAAPFKGYPGLLLMPNEKLTRILSRTSGIEHIKGVKTIRAPSGALLVTEGVSNILKVVELILQNEFTIDDCIELGTLMN